MEIHHGTGVFYYYAFDPCAWVAIRNQLIYWPAHCMHDCPLMFQHSGIVRFLLRSGELVVAKPDETLGLQIILCGVLLALQLVGGKSFKSRLFEDQMHTLETFDLRKLEKEIIKHVPAATRTFDKISKDFQRKAGTRVEELLKLALFPLLKAAKKVAARAEKDSVMSEVEFE